jgi:hypothetical protein
MTQPVPIKLHAKLSASGSAKWMNCTPSMKMEADFPDEQSAFAAEGTFAHAVFEQELNDFLGRPVDVLNPADVEQYDSPALRDYVMDAVRAVIERVKEAYAVCKDPKIMVEQQVDFSPWVTQGFGTADVIIVTDQTLEVMDLKYGKGIAVMAAENSQMRLYGLGAHNMFGDLYDFKRVRMTILQPRLSNYDSEELATSQLLDWGRDVVKPRAKLAWAGEGELVAGEHCSKGFCRARFQCPARAQLANDLAAQDFALSEPRLLTLDQIALILTKADAAIDWLNDVKSYALKQAEKGVDIPGHKLVEGRSNRKYANSDRVVEKLREAGVPDEVIFEKALRTITALEKDLGKKEFARLLGDLITKPSGKPTLVPAGDKRPALTALATANADFS